MSGNKKTIGSQVAGDLTEDHSASTSEMRSCGIDGDVSPAPKALTDKDYARLLGTMGSGYPKTQM